MPSNELEIMTAIADLHGAVGRVEGKVDAFYMDAQRQERALKAVDHRVGALEKSRAYFLGAVGVVSFVGASAWHFFMKDK